MSQFRTRNKLTEDQVRGILALRKDPVKGGPYAREVAQEYGVSEHAILKIWRRQTWQHVPNPRPREL